MDESRASTEEIINYYKGEVERLVAYLPWFTKTSGTNLWNTYTPEQSGPGTLKVPVYDTNLLNFVKLFQKTKFYNKNYVYSYSKYRIKNWKDELDVIDKIELKNMHVLGDILSRYVIKGMTRGVIWNEGVEYGIYEHAIAKMKELIDYYTRPGK